MKRNILLVEPGYRTKFPPLGLMKISSYHKKLNDNVKFVKGIDKNIPYENIWHRIYISTVFTYNWKVTVDTIKYYKSIVNGDSSRIVVGGIMASLMPENLWKETGVVPIPGLLSEPGQLGDNNKYIVNDMIPDYELFENKDYISDDKDLDGYYDREPNFEYALVADSYFGYLTRGCIRKCEFCGVSILEPEFIEYKGIRPYIEKIKNRYGEKCHLILFDNNVLASKRLEDIIHDLKDLGFEKGSRYEYNNKEGRKISRQRHVDFNQGIDARLMTKKKTKLLAELAIHPLRIAFDHLKYKDLYIKKVQLAAGYEIQHLSNYILYNYDDTPQDLWKRLKINIDLNTDLGLKIYSFPMKFIPLMYKDRSYINEPNWNRKFLRNVQAIINVVKGSVMGSEDFFHRAFGKNEKEFLEILHMPEKILMFRGRTPHDLEKEWFNKFHNLSKGERKELLTIICNNWSVKNLRKAIVFTNNRKIKTILEYYLPDDLNDATLLLNNNLG